MSRPSPRQVFDDPQTAWAYLTQATDDDFEGQHFDRKEAGRPQNTTPISKSLDAVKELVTKTVSAFANSNAEGGLLVLGISSSGEVVGIDHLTEEQRNAISNVDNLLRSHAAEIKFHDCIDANGADKTVCLVYSGHVPNAICETFGSNPKAWVRNGSQSVLMGQSIRDQVRRRKRVLDEESAPCCLFSSDDIDAEVVKEFRRVFHPETTSAFNDERVLYEAGAIVRSNDQAFFTTPGLLFFASNPQRILAHAYLRLMKFLVPSGQRASRGTPSFDKDFRGPVTKQIRAARTFLRETSFFERFQHRKPDGGFAEESELPAIAVDEAIVNAVAHRDYYTHNPVECEHYSDEFVIKNPGRILQRNVDLPDRFTLGATTLDSMPRNRKLLEWLRLIQDPDGKAFVHALSEGTKRMTREMVALNLPAPSYVLLENETILRLESHAEARKAAFLASIKVPQTAFINLFPLTISKGPRHATNDEVHLRIGEFSRSLRDSLAAHGWYIDRFSFSRIVAHGTGIDLPIPVNVRKLIRFFPGYCLQIHEMFGRVYMSIDYTCRVLSILRANELVHHIRPEDLAVKYSKDERARAEKEFEPMVQLVQHRLAQGVVSTFFVRRMHHHRQKPLPWRHWLKWVVVVDLDQQFLLAQIARRGPWNDCANLPAVVETASQQTRIGLVLADAEFDSERNHTYIRKQLGAQSVIPAKRGKKTWRIHGVRAEMRRSFPRQLYRRRSLIESLFQLGETQTLRASARSHFADAEASSSLARIEFQSLPPEASLPFLEDVNRAKSVLSTKAFFAR